MKTLLEILDVLAKRAARSIAGRGIEEIDGFQLPAACFGFDNLHPLCPGMRFQECRQRHCAMATGFAH